MRTLILALVFVALVQPAEAKHHRNQAAKVEFQHIKPCSATCGPKDKCAGYVIHHVIPLACGGLDAPSNMQWQTEADAKSKDKWERKVYVK